MLFKRLVHTFKFPGHLANRSNVSRAIRIDSFCIKVLKLCYIIQCNKGENFTVISSSSNETEPLFHPLWCCKMYDSLKEQKEIADENIVHPFNLESS